jgi:hypothetical protein
MARQSRIAGFRLTAASEPRASWEPEPLQHCGLAGAANLGAYWHAQTTAALIAFPGVLIQREREGEGWLVLAPNGHGWQHGDRPSALREKRWHDRQWGRR